MNGISTKIDYEEVARRYYDRLKDASDKKITVQVTPKSAVWAYFGTMFHSCEKEVRDEKIVELLAKLPVEGFLDIYSRLFADELLAARKDLPGLIEVDFPTPQLNAAEQMAFLKVRLTDEGRVFLAKRGPA